jgi:hypothetical protein
LITGAKYPTSCFLSSANAESCFPGYPKPPDNDLEDEELD